MRIKLFILAAAAAITTVIPGITQWSRIKENALWQELSQRVPAQPLSAIEIEITDGAVSGRITPENDEIGHISLANGETWRFAFRSHHLVGGPDSFSVFAGPSGRYRVRGAHFCCEVQLPECPILKDSNEFLAFLRDSHDSVQPVE